MRIRHPYPNHAMDGRRRQASRAPFQDGKQAECILRRPTRDAEHAACDGCPRRRPPAPRTPPGLYLLAAIALILAVYYGGLAFLEERARIRGRGTSAAGGDGDRLPQGEAGAARRKRGSKKGRKG